MFASRLKFRCGITKIILDIGVEGKIIDQFKKRAELYPNTVHIISSSAIKDTLRGIFQTSKICRPGFSCKSKSGD